MRNVISMYIGRARNGGPTYDPAVVAWGTTALISDSFWLQSMSDAVIALRDYNIWDKIIYCNPCAGATTQSLSTPLKHPTSLQSLIAGSPLIDANGIKGDGVATYMNIQMNPDPYIPSLYDVHSAFYQNLATGFNPANGFGRSFGGYTIGQNPNSDGGWRAAFCTNGSETNGFTDPPYNLSPSTRITNNFIAPDKYTGFIIASRTSAARAVFARNGVVLQTNTNNLLTRSPNLSYGMTSGGRTNLWQRPIFWMAENTVTNANWDLGVRAQLDTRYVSSARYAWMSNGTSLSDADIANYNTVIQTLQTAWGRQV